MSTRRAFFLSGGAAVATTASVAVAGAGLELQQEFCGAKDREAIRAALAELFANRECWQDLSRGDELTIHDRQRATATVHFEEEESRPLEGNCTAAQMARLQGNVANRQWVARCVEVDLSKIEGVWTISGVRPRWLQRT